MKKNDIPLHEGEKEMVIESCKFLIDHLQNAPTAHSVKQMACGYYSSQNKETYEIQVIVTRKESDFMEPLVVEATY